MPLILTVLFADVASKLAPLMVTTVPTMPLVGVIPFIARVVTGTGVTVKVEAEIAVPPGVVMAMFPLVAPGTVTESEVVVACVTLAGVPSNVTMSFWGDGSNFVPAIVTVDPTVPLVGELVIVGAVALPEVCTTKLVEESTEPPAVATVITPFEAPVGTITTSDVDVAEATVACLPFEPLILTELLAATGSKLVPLMVIADPTTCQAGEKPEIVGAAVAAKARTVDPLAPVEVASAPPVEDELPPHEAKSSNTENKVTYNSALFILSS